MFSLKRKVTQDGEDKILKEIFKYKKSGLYVDVGCYHPIELSNTALLYNRGWKGINIDISEYSIKLFNFLKPDDINLNLAVSNFTGIQIYFIKDYQNINKSINKQVLKYFREK